MTPYDPANVFAKILRGELPCHKVHEDDHTFAFMDIMPRVEGHTLVIPKVAARTILDIPPDALGNFMAQVQRVGRAAVRAMAADGLTLHQFNESAGGQIVFHLHVHILPRKEGVAMKPHPAPQGDHAVLANHAAAIRAALADA